MELKVRIPLQGESLGGEHWEKSKHASLEELTNVLKSTGYWSEGVHKALYEEEKAVAVKKRRVNLTIGGTYWRHL